MIQIDNEFMEEHEGLVRAIVKQYTYRDFKEDLLQEGRIGLMEAAKRFDPSTGVKFESYAVWWIRKYIREAIQTYGCVLSLPSHRVCDAELERVDLDMPLYDEDDDVITLEDTIEDTCITEKMERHELVEDLMTGSGLSEREKVAVKLYFGLGHKNTPINEAAMELETGYWNAYKIVKKGIEKMQKKAGTIPKK